MTSRTGNYDQEELRAVAKTEHIFEKWVRQIKTAYTAPVIDRKNQTNVYGVELPPPMKDIKYKLL